MYHTILAASAAAGAVLFSSGVAAQQPYNNWDNAYQQADKLMESWTVENQANISVRSGTAPGYLPFTVSDGPIGLAGGSGVSGWITPQTLASSWDRTLIREQFGAMAVEFRLKGYAMLLGPTTGPLGRSAFGGRLFESLGSDPYLNGKLFAEGVSAIQSEGVIACGKHYLGNEQETNRTASNNAADRTSSNIDDRTLHEVYLWPWVDGVAAGLGSAMCAMNRVNGEVGCENDHLMNTILKGELGFKGLIVPDATAPVNETAGILAGLDWNSGLDLPGFVDAIKKGAIPESVVKDHARRIVATQLNYNMPQNEFADVNKVKTINVRDPKSAQWIREAASQSIVLLENKDNTLPLSKKDIQAIGVFGRDAANLGTGPVSALNFNDFQGDVYASHLVSGGGSANAPNPYIVSPLDALGDRARDYGFQYRYILSDNFTVVPPAATGAGFFASQGVSVSSYASQSDHCLVFINAFSKEGSDRQTLADPTSDQLVQSVAKYCSSTIVVMNNAGVRLVDEWIDHPNITAVLNAGALGQESGNSIVDVLFGDVNPSGKLPYTIAKKASDYNGQICACCECDYTEKLDIDYRHFDEAGIEPRYEFGYGLSYTTFEYSNVQVGSAPSKIDAYPSGKVVQGGQEDLFDTLLNVTATIKNTGSVEGGEVAQLYLTFPEQAQSPVKQLRGFEKVWLQPGESKTVQFALQRRDVSVWDTDKQAWKVEAGQYKALVGKSSRNIVGEADFSLST